MKDIADELTFVDGGATAGPNASAPRAGHNREVRFAGPSFESSDGDRIV